MPETTFDRLIALLDHHQVAHDVMRHQAVYTSEEAARVRGTQLASGAKALVCRADEGFVLFVMPADRRLASKLARRNAGIRSLRFASREEVLQLTGLTPGAIPPFGSLFGLITWCDRRLAEQPTINFNAGDHSVSISMTYRDFERIEQPRIGEFAE
jgi:Ala-tRNA(Pro) deacylase